MDSKYYIVRTYSAGVFFGKIVEREGKLVEMKDAIRLWYWSGAASLSQLAMEGVKNPTECKFAMPVNKVILTEAIEILEVTEIGAKIILGVEPWKK